MMLPATTTPVVVWQVTDSVAAAYEHDVPTAAPC